MKEQYTNNSGDWKYYAVVPRIIILNTTPYELALWTAIKDILGEYRTCKLSTEQLAIYAGISVGMVVKCRKSLIEKKFIIATIKQDDGYNPVYNYSLPDLWPRNIEFANQFNDIRDRLAHREIQKNSLHPMKASPHEGSLPSEPSPHEAYNKTKEEEERGAVIYAYEKSTGKPIYPLMADKLEILMEKWKEHLALVDNKNPDINVTPGEAVIAALNVAVENEADRVFPYAESTLENWIRHGFGYNPNEKNDKRNNNQVPEGMSNAKDL